MSVEGEARGEVVSGLERDLREVVGGAWVLNKFQKRWQQAFLTSVIQRERERVKKDSRILNNFLHSGQIKSKAAVSPWSDE